MSNTVRDLRCPDGHYECSVFYKLSDGPPVCLGKTFVWDPCVEVAPGVIQERWVECACGKPRTPFYATREMEGKAAREHVDPTLAGFTSVKYDGEWRSRSEMDSIKNALADRRGVPRDSLDFSSVGNKDERSDFYRHRAYESRKSAGFDTQQFKEYQREQLRQH
jgi:hypothetical protein